ncbi:Glucanosyltransferase-domain-containing protein [Lophiotrema nucula]|uniref:1,3-beta-glucanosyltransferase n=1 Tax=Lophiotrema nucula TaxID=690887 RepID=A0A6A5YT73_9PLEO|nr:Glucanosyltransferase-domain-containing protein [Lophiotrema nucula]
MIRWSIVLWVIVALLDNVVAEADPIIVKGSHFFYKTNGTQFLVRGIGYQSSNTGDFVNQYQDILADGPTCQRDIPYLKELNTNVVYFFNQDPSRDHSACMNAFADAGIYVITFLEGLERGWYFETITWNVAMLDQFKKVVDNMAQYTNTLGFYLSRSLATPYTGQYDPLMKAAVRDIKNYIRDKNYRQIPVGYFASNANVTSLGYQKDFMACTDDVQTHPDFIGITLVSNQTTDCTNATSIEPLVELFKNTTIPVFVGAYGCNNLQLEANAKNDTREWPETAVIYNQKTIEVLSGGIAFEFFQNPRLDGWANQGLVVVQGGTVTRTPGFKTLAKAMANTNPNLLNAANYTPSAILPPCPTKNVFWNAEPVIPATPNDDLCSCMFKTLSCVASPTVLQNMTTYNGTGEAWATNVTATCEGTDTKENCAGITANGTLGYFGAFSGCNEGQIYSWTTNNYFQRHGEGSCDMDGTAQLQDLAPSDAKCEFLLDQVGSEGTGTLTATVFQPSVTGSSPPSSSSGPLSPVGVKIGIGFSIGAFLISTMVVVLWLVRRKKRKLPHPEVPELETFDASRKYVRGELEAKVVYEAPCVVAEACTEKEQAAELPDNCIPREVDGSSMSADEPPDPI